MGIMSKSEFMYWAIDLVFTVRMQGTITLENYKNTTISGFNYGLLEDYRIFEEFYDRTVAETKRISIEEIGLYNSKLMVFLKKAKEASVKNILQQMEKDISARNVKYDIYIIFRIR